MVARRQVGGPGGVRVPWEGSPSGDLGPSTRPSVGRKERERTEGRKGLDLTKELRETYLRPRHVTGEKVD